MTASATGGASDISDPGSSARRAAFIALYTLAFLGTCLVLIAPLLSQRGLVSGVLGVCLPVASVSGTYVVQLFSGSQLAMFLAPCAIAALIIAPFAARLDDRRLALADRPS